jgi:hypothetical protein
MLSRLRRSTTRESLVAQTDAAVCCSKASKDCLRARHLLGAGSYPNITHAGGAI